jgi:beta-mannosidase
MMIKLGTSLWNLTEKNHWKSLQEWMKGWGIKIERSVYNHIPPVAKTPQDLLHAREVWETWRFHDFQPPETFDNGIALGDSLDQFISNSQAYQGHLIQYATECYRRSKYATVAPGSSTGSIVSASSTGKVTGLIQFDFCDPWPSVTWSVVDYWRTPKPAFDALRRSMQPLLPCFRLPENMEAGRAMLVSFCVVNDLAQAFSAATCEWRLEGDLGDLASATFPVDIPADGVSAETKLTLPSLQPGKYSLLVTVTSNRATLGENWYELTVNYRDPLRTRTRNAKNTKKIRV